MTQKSPLKQFLLENHRNICQLTKNSIQNHIGINTEQRDIETNTEEVAGAIGNGNTVEEMAPMFIQAETSESYWKLMTERRREAIQETHIENAQLHSLADDLSKENDKLRVIANHCDYLQNVLETLAVENDSLFNETIAE